MTTIINTVPPNFVAIKAVFPQANEKTTVFAFGEFIYVPSGSDLAPEILEHELVHCERQLKQGVDEWWAQYLTDPEFRYEEELLAHRAELKKLCELYPNRRQRRYFIQHVAKKLSAQLYGRLRKTQECVEDLRDGQ